MSNPIAKSALFSFGVSGAGALITGSTLPVAGTAALLAATAAVVVRVMLGIFFENFGRQLGDTGRLIAIGVVATLGYAVAIVALNSLFYCAIGSSALVYSALDCHSDAYQWIGTFTLSSLVGNVAFVV